MPLVAAPRGGKRKAGGGAGPSAGRGRGNTSVIEISSEDEHEQEPQGRKLRSGTVLSATSSGMTIKQAREAARSSPSVRAISIISVSSGAGGGASAPNSQRSAVGAAGGAGAGQNREGSSDVEVLAPAPRAGGGASRSRARTGGAGGADAGGARTGAKRMAPSASLESLLPSPPPLLHAVKRRKEGAADGLGAIVPIDYGAARPRVRPQPRARAGSPRHDLSDHAEPFAVPYQLGRKSDHDAALARRHARDAATHAELQRMKAVLRETERQAAEARQREAARKEAERREREARKAREREEAALREAEAEECVLCYEVLEKPGAGAATSKSKGKTGKKASAVKLIHHTGEGNCGHGMHAKCYIKWATFLLTKGQPVICGRCDHGWYDVSVAHIPMRDTSQPNEPPIDWAQEYADWSDDEGGE